MTIASQLRRMALDIEEGSSAMLSHPDALRRLAQQVDDLRHDLAALLAPLTADGLWRAREEVRARRKERRLRGNRPVRIGSTCRGYKRGLDSLGRCRVCGCKFPKNKRAPWHAEAVA